MELGKVIEDYRTLLFSKFQKKKDMFCENYELLKLYARSGFLVVSPCLSFFGSVALRSYRSYMNICVREISCHLDLY